MSPSGFEAFRSVLKLDDIVPRPDHKPTGEERAWGRRLAKRFGIDGSYEDRSFVASGNGVPPCVLDHETLKPDAVDPGIAALFADVDPVKGDSLVACGWAMAEDLAALA